MFHLEDGQIQKENSLLLNLLFYLGLQQIGCGPRTLGSLICFLWSTDGNSNLIQKHLEIMFNQTSMCLFKLTTK